MSETSTEHLDRFKMTFDDFRKRQDKAERKWKQREQRDKALSVLVVEYHRLHDDYIRRRSDTIGLDRF